MKVAAVATDYCPRQYNEVKKQMLELGRPKLKAFWHQDLQLWCALEGCHRLRVSKLYGLTPIILPVVYRSNKLVRNCGVEYYARDTMWDIYEQAYTKLWQRKYIYQFEDQ